MASGLARDTKTLAKVLQEQKIIYTIFIDSSKVLKGFGPLGREPPAQRKVKRNVKHDIWV